MAVPLPHHQTIGKLHPRLTHNLINLPAQCHIVAPVRAAMPPIDVSVATTIFSIISCAAANSTSSRFFSRTRMAISSVFASTKSLSALLLRCAAQDRATNANTHPAIVLIETAMGQPRDYVLINKLLHALCRCPGNPICPAPRFVTPVAGCFG